MGVRLRLLGAHNVDYLVPDRVADGYGLTHIHRPPREGTRADVITVDNGIASVEGVAEAKALGLQSARHRPPPARPRPACGRRHRQPQPARLHVREQVHGRVGVMFYVTAGPARRAAARAVCLTPHPPSLDPCSPWSPLGTVADVVKLDANNRRLVAQGLKRIRAGQCPRRLPCSAAARPSAATTFDLALPGPAHQRRRPSSRHDAGHRMPADRRRRRAAELATTLDGINRERREIERRHARAGH